MFMGKPVIGVTTSSNHLATGGQEPRQLVLNANYVHAIAVAGGIPVVACEECPQVFAELCDGLLMTGGPDVAPSRYGEEPLNDSVKPDPLRDAYEQELLTAYLDTGKPIFGICRGMQFLNVFLGGSLYQDLEEESGWNHRDRGIRHPVITQEGSILRRLFGEEFLVNTIHHQSVKELGRGLKVTARSPQGIIEAYEHESLPIFATQFHPEKLSNSSFDGTTQDFQPIFDYFLKLVREQAQSGR